MTSNSLKAEATSSIGSVSARCLSRVSFHQLMESKSTRSAPPLRVWHQQKSAPGFQHLSTVHGSLKAYRGFSAALCGKDGIGSSMVARRTQSLWHEVLECSACAGSGFLRLQHRLSPSSLGAKVHRGHAAGILFLSPVQASSDG